MSKRFGGFQLAADPSVPVPTAFFSDVLPQLSDLAEIQVTLTLFRLAHERGGFDQPVPEQDVVRDRPLRQSLRSEGSPREPDRRIANGLDLAVGRGTLLSFAATHGQDRQVWYYVNTVANRAQIVAMIRGAVAPPPATWKGASPPSVEPERPTVFRLYEQNIGLLTPLIAERLVDALETYPTDWIGDAIAEAVTYNRRSWRYVHRILENWAVTGRGDTREAATHETHRRRNPNTLDPDQYQHGRYLDRARNN